MPDMTKTMRPTSWPGRVMLALLLSGCAAMPAKLGHESQITPPAKFNAPAANTAATVQLSQWWTAWNDPALNQLVAQALAANEDIKVAMAHVTAARDVVSMSESELYPMVAADGALWGSESSDNADQTSQLGTLLSPYLESSGGSGHVVNLGASWEPDIFGGKHADIAAARALAASSAHEAEGVRLMVAADVVENYQELQGLRRRLVILDQSIALASRQVDYVSARMQAGSATGADISLARNGLEQLQAQRAPLAALIDARYRRLAVLTGAAPEQRPEISDISPLTVPPPPTGQLPSAVLDRRPDVQAWASIVQARAARLKSLKTDLLPRFGIQFLGQNGRISLSGLPGVGGTGGAIGISASVPIFMGGLLRARVAAGNAELEAATASYNQTVLSALEEVESDYGFRVAMDEKLTDMRQASDISAQRAEQVQALYTAGRATLGDVLQAQLTALQDEDGMVQTSTAQGSAAVELYRALGGGY